MSMGMTMSHRLEQRQELSLTQRHALLQSQQLSCRLALLQVLTGDNYEPNGKCPECQRQLTPVEILKGFNQNPVDYTTRCTGCGHRFAPKLICFGNQSRIELPFYCEQQALAQLKGMEAQAPEQIAKSVPAVYRSLVFHCGNLKTAFSRLNVDYTLEKEVDWKNKIQPFLGKLADSVIAECAGITVNKVRRMRKKLGINAYSVERALEEIEDEDY